MGDLKDQLGIRHRKGKNDNSGSSSTLEAAPMFHEQHARSLSELSTQNQYEPTMTTSPGIGTSAPRQTYLDTPPMSEASDTTFREPTQYVYPKTNMDQELYLSPNPRDSRQLSPASPHPSYYSASDIPPPSPMPSPQYRLPSGEITTTPPTPTSRRGSVATTRSIRGGPQAPMPSSPLPAHPMSPPKSPNTLQLPSGQGHGVVRRTSAGSSSHHNPGAYEMRALSPPNEYASSHGHYGGGHHGERSASSASYATAADDFWSAQDEIISSPTSPTGRQSQASHIRQPGMTGDGDDDDDGATVMERSNNRRSDTVSWDGGRAL